MTADPLAQLGAEYQAAKKRHERAAKAARKAVARRQDMAAEVEALREPLREEIVKAGHERRRPAEIARLTGYGPEMVRQILREAGVEPFEPKPPRKAASPS